MKLIVHKHTIEIEKTPVNEKEINVSKCTFEFDEDMQITDEYVKEAYFTLNGKSYVQIIEDNECSYPSEVLEEKGTLEIGVVAYLLDNDEYAVRYNPRPVYFGTWDGSLKENAKNSSIPTPSEMEQVLQALNKKQNLLISGVNIKTINYESILGEGNLDIAGGGSVPLIEDEKLIFKTGGSAHVIGEELIL